jgi:DNA-binding transcriptional regulator LsrR (DeoR family)
VAYITLVNWAGGLVSNRGTGAGQGPAELVLAAGVARRHYLQGKSRIEIADELGISRFKVARLLETARAKGIVRIEIARQGDLDVDLSAQLQERFGLVQALVLEGTGPEIAVRASLGAAAARLLSEVLHDGDVLGLPWSRSVSEVVAALEDLPQITVVQLSGALILPDIDTSPVDLVRRTARLAGGEAHVFYAPFILDDAESAAALVRQPAVAVALAQIEAVTTAVVGVGAWAKGLSTIYDVSDADTRKEVTASGVIGEAAGVFFDSQGEVVEPPISDRMVNIRGDQLCAIPDVVAIASGTAKSAAVEAAVRGGLVNSLVVDQSLAAELLAAQAHAPAIGERRSRSD